MTRTTGTGGGEGRGEEGEGERGGQVNLSFEDGERSSSNGEVLQTKPMENQNDIAESLKKDKIGGIKETVCDLREVASHPRETAGFASGKDKTSFPMLATALQVKKIAKRKLNKAASILLVLILTAYVALVIFLSWESRHDLDAFWCDGAGFLIILSACLLSGFIYKMVLKKYFFRRIWKVLKGPSAKIARFSQKYWIITWAGRSLILLLILIFLIFDSREERRRLSSAVGIVAILGFGFVFSASPTKVNWSVVSRGLLLQFLLGLVVLRWNVGKAIFECAGRKIDRFLGFTMDGASFVFGYLADPKGATGLKCANDTLANGDISSCGLVEPLPVFAFKVLPVILFFSFVIQILYFYGVMQGIVMALGSFFKAVIGSTACESVNTAANIFLGQSEAPILIKPFLPLMTRSELHTVMTGGFATVSGSVLAAFISFGISASHLLSASVISAPAAIAFSKLFYPEREASRTNPKDLVVPKSEEVNALHAGITGVMNAIPLVAIIGANLVAFIAFIAFFNAVFNWSCLLVSIPDQTCTLENLFGYAFMPLAWVIGVDWSESRLVGELIGVKTVVNEFVAYKQLGEMKDKLSERSAIIATYALCGFSNFSSIGIQLGALGTMAPDRRGDLVRLALRAMVAGSATCFLTACTAGLLISSDY